MWNPKTKINERTEQKQTPRYGEGTDGCQQAGSWGLNEKVKGLRSTNWQLQNSHGDADYSVINNIVLIMYV